MTWSFLAEVWLSHKTTDIVLQSGTSNLNLPSRISVMCACKPQFRPAFKLLLYVCQTFFFARLHTKMNFS